MRVRQIVFVEFEPFYTHSETLRQPKLAGQPLGVAEGNRLLAVSPEAIEWNVEPGEAVAMARRRCPALRVLPYCEDSYQELHTLCWDLVARYSPLVEPVDWHAGYADLTGCLTSEETLLRFAGKLKHEVLHATQLTVRLGGGRTKPTARLAALADRCLLPEEERVFLFSLPVHEAVAALSERSCSQRFPQASLFSPAVEKLIERFQRLGLWTLGDLAALPENTVRQRFGTDGLKLHRVAYGLHCPQVRLLYPLPVLEEALRLEGQEEEQLLSNLVVLLSDRLWERLRSTAQAAREVALIVTGRFRIEDCQSAIHNCRKPSGEGLSSPLRVASRKLARPIASKEHLRALALQLLKELGPPAGVTQLTLRGSNLSRVVASQGGLFEKPASETALDKVLAHLRQRFGVGVVLTGASLLQKRRRRMAEMILELADTRRPCTK